MTDKENFGPLEKELAQYTRAIGHPARIAILIAIAFRGNKIEGEIIDVPPLSKSTVMQHLRELKRAGFLQGRIFGAKAEYYIDLEHLNKFKDVFSLFMKNFTEFNDQQ